MSIFLSRDNKVIVQGITGSEATVHTARMLRAGTQIVGGVNARKAGTTVTHEDKGGRLIKLPVFGSVAEAMEKTGADVSIIFVPPTFAKDAIIEAIDAEIPLLVVITEGIPVQDTAYAWAYNLEAGHKTRIIGPNCPGIISPGQSLAGITPANITGPGPIGLVSKSGTLTYQMMFELRDLGFSTAIGIGGDPVIGTTHIDAIEAFERDPDTKLIVMIGEIGGDAEERAADFIKTNVSKPVVGYVAGFTAPEGKTMGHAGAIVSGSSGTAAAKQEALEAAGVKVGKTPSATAALAREICSPYTQQANLAASRSTYAAASSADLSGIPNSTSVTPSSAQRASLSGTGLTSRATICGSPSRPAAAQMSCSNFTGSSMSTSRGVVIQPSALRAIHLKFFSVPAAPTSTGMCGCTGLGQAQLGPNLTNSPS